MQEKRMFTIGQLILMFDTYRGIGETRHSFNSKFNQEIGNLLRRQLIVVVKDPAPFEFEPTEKGKKFVTVCKGLGVKFIQQVCDNRSITLTCNQMIVLLDCAIKSTLNLGLHLGTLETDLGCLICYGLITKIGEAYRVTGDGRRLIDYWKALSIVP